jgi:hypothetical protein
MNWLHNAVLLGRLVILPLALLQWGIILALLPRLLSFPRGSWQAVFIDIVLIATSLGVLAAQIHGYQWITGRRRANDDNFFFAVIMIEYLFSLFLTFRILKRKGGFFSEDTSGGIPIPLHLDQTSCIARSEFISQVDCSERHGVRVFWVGWAICMLLIWPVVIYSYVFARGHSRRASLTFDALACGIALLSLGCFYLVMRRAATKYAPACSSCGRKITWREKNNVLNSGQCPHCNAGLFKAV